MERARLALALAATLAISCSGSGSAPAASARVASASAAPTLAAPSPTQAATASSAVKALWSAVPAPDYPCGPGMASGSCAPSGTEWIGIESGLGRPIVAAVLRPSGAAAGAATVIYLHSDEGLLSRDVDLAASFAKEGSLVVVPCWQGPIGRLLPRNIGCTSSAPLRSSAADVVMDVSAVADAVRTLPGARTDRVVVVGHSGGAIAAVLTGSMGGRVDAVVALSAGYGTGIKQRWGTSAPEQVDGLAVPLLIVHGTDGTQNAGTSIDTVRAYEKAARDKGKRVTTVYVDGGTHLFPFAADQWTDTVRAKVVTFIKG